MAEFLAVSGVAFWLLYLAGATVFAVLLYQGTRDVTRPLTRKERLRAVFVTLAWPVGVITIVRSEP